MGDTKMHTYRHICRYVKIQRYISTRKRVCVHVRVEEDDGITDS